MKIIFTTALLIVLFSFRSNAQGVDIYPSNLPDNTYFGKYDDKTKTISGINFLTLTDGTNSKTRTAPFSVKLYLLVPGTSEPIFVKTIETDGQYHMSSREFKDLSVDLSDVSGLTAGTYRLGIYVDSEKEIAEPNEDNNAVLFPGELKIGSGQNTQEGQKPLIKIDGNKDDDNPEKDE
jgi:hypothetical protein